jgi:hypothetical protein
LIARTPIIRIARARGHYRDSIRAYRVEIDGQAVGTLRPGDVKDFPVTPGEHGVRLTVDWCSSPTRVVRLGDGQWTQFCCRPNGWFFEVWRILIDTINYISLEQAQTPAT